ncbi:ABC transporter ATP-binding protein [Brevibacterium sp. FME17]|uniref:ABC transporter ATP-binding protein n=1 Tax=Brevibacterium sp. FME17 TaxID=2742606 RepID=UPI001867FC00|nr:sn-glycerol-3-phosphate ABC transporter ATP-binding protein UgpC [Brevibacterium sp. FME17]
MANANYQNVTLKYPHTDQAAVSNLNLDIRDGEFLVLVGPSGCGKSTALRMLAGLEEVSTGRLLIDGEDMTAVEPKDRDIAMVFQNYALYPHMSVADNIGFGLKIAGVKRADRHRRIQEVAEKLDLTDYLDRKPKALSGGQRQRVAMGRAIIRKPRVFLMDEPLSNLDAKLRVQTRTWIASLQRELGVTTVYVTHDQTEALTMGHRIAVLKLGELQQVGTPRELLDRPINTFVASFIGSPAMNLVDMAVSANGIVFGNADMPLAPVVLNALSTARVTVGIRPEDLKIRSAGLDGISVRTKVIEELGADGYLHGIIESPSGEHPLVVRVDGRSHAAEGEFITVLPEPENVHLFDSLTGKRIGTPRGLDTN